MILKKTKNDDYEKLEKSKEKTIKKLYEKLVGKEEEINKNEETIDDMKNTENENEEDTNKKDTINNEKDNNINQIISDIDNYSSSSQNNYLKKQLFPLFIPSDDY